MADVAFMVAAHPAILPDIGDRGPGSGQSLESAHGTQLLLQCGRITFHPVVLILAAIALAAIVIYWL
jgi:hypothetical protein